MKRNVAPVVHRTGHTKISEIPEARICRAIKTKMGNDQTLSISGALKSCANGNVALFRKYATVYFKYTKGQIVALNNNLREAEEIFSELDTLIKGFPLKKDLDVPLFAVKPTVTPIATPKELPGDDQQMEEQRPWWAPGSKAEVREVLSALPSELRQRLKRDYLQTSP